MQYKIGEALRYCHRALDVETMKVHHSNARRELQWSQPWGSKARRDVQRIVPYSFFRNSLARADRYLAYGAVVGARINKPLLNYIGVGTREAWRPAPVGNVLAAVSLVTQAALVAVGAGCGLIYGVTVGVFESANVKLGVYTGLTTFPYPDDHPETLRRNKMRAEMERAREEDMSRISKDPDPSEMDKLWLEFLRTGMA